MKSIICNYVTYESNEIFIVWNRQNGGYYEI